jgi:hypothetical protein
MDELLLIIQDGIIDVSTIHMGSWVWVSWGVGGAQENGRPE